MEDMRQPLFIKNTPIDEKRINFIELMVSRLMRRARKKHTALITPYPISNVVFGENVEGCILRYMFPCSGNITKAMLYLDKKPKEDIELFIDLIDNTGGMSKNYFITQKQTTIDTKIPVISGTRLEISLNHIDVITEAWISFLWVPSIKDIEAKSYLINDLESGLLEG